MTGLTLQHGAAADDEAAATVPYPESRELAITGKMLLIPIAKGQEPYVKGKPRGRLTVHVDGVLVHNNEVHLAQNPEDIQWWAALDMRTHVGRQAVLTITPPDRRAGVPLIESADHERYLQPLYNEALRPQFHFSQRLGWNNDVNGLVYYDGEWHLYYQYCPTALRHADKHWGHAVSRDLVHWEELPIALYAWTLAKGHCFSGSAVVDHRNTAGFQRGNEPPIIAVFSDFGSGQGECLAYSHDRGRTFTYYEGNPVLRHPGNDPKVIWYVYGKDDQPLDAKALALGGHWVMAVYDHTREYDKNIAFYTSTDLKSWTEQSHLPGYAECPELVQLPVDPSPSGGAARETRWVTFAADAQYAVGRFDGRTFTPEHEGKHRVHYGAYFASQIFNNAPDGRRIQMGWARLNLPDMPFSQAFTLPHRLTLRRTPDGIRLFAKPIAELAALRRKSYPTVTGDLAPDSPRSVAVSGELFEFRAEFVIGEAQSVGIEFGGNRTTYDVVRGTLNGVSMAPIDGKVSMQVMVDRPMIEVCGNDGAVYITSDRRRRGAMSSVSAFATGGPAQLIAFDVHELGSIWKQP